MRWAVIAMVSGTRFAVRTIPEERIWAYVPAGIARDGDWSVLITDTEMVNLQIDDVRRDDEKGRR